jgi:paraquat-inducible protein A
MHVRNPDSVVRTLALLVTACILYIPANVLPIMTTDQLGRSVDSTILGGVVLLWNMGSYPVAGVIFFASVMVPVSKLLIMFALCWSVLSGHAKAARQRTTLYRITEFIGKWSMIDVFVVAVLVVLIRLGGILVIQPGVAAVAFAGVVAVTMVAAEGFDPRLIWDKEQSTDE